MARTATSTAMLPLYTLDLARRYWAPLLCVYITGKFLHDMLLRGMVWLSEIHQILGLMGLSLSVLVTLATTIIMFHLLRPALPAVDYELLGGSLRGRATLTERERRLVDAVAMAILPFLIFYSAQGLFAEEYRQYAVGLLNERGLEGFAEPTELDALGLPLLVAVGSWCVRAFVEYFYRRSQNKALGLLTALFEANWVFFAVLSVLQLISDAEKWVFSRAAWQGLQNMISEGLQSLGDLTHLPVEASYLALLAAIAAAWDHLKDGLFEPLLWLTIAAVVFGAQLDGTDLFRKGKVGQRIEKIVAPTSGLLRSLNRFTGRDMRDKYAPFLNALRFILRASPVFYLSFCLYYILLEFGFTWLHRGVYIVVGPADFLGWWWQWLIPVETIVDALHELLRVCLLAATFEVTLRRVGSTSTGRRARRAAHTA